MDKSLSIMYNTILYLKAIMPYTEGNYENSLI